MSMLKSVRLSGCQVVKLSGEIVRQWECSMFLGKPETNDDITLLNRVDIWWLSRKSWCRGLSYVLLFYCCMIHLCHIIYNRTNYLHEEILHVFSCQGLYNNFSSQWYQDLEYPLQVIGLSHVCILGCIIRLPASVNTLKHSMQVNGFSPICILRWIIML